MYNILLNAGLVSTGEQTTKSTNQQNFSCRSTLVSDCLC